jgi:phosphatidylserine/phosphatidylglycerophosphate/cardiolipin synthase-like enzyme
LASAEVMRGYLEEHDRKRAATLYALTYTLLHSYAHHVMHTIAQFSGLDLGSMGEQGFLYRSLAAPDRFMRLAAQLEGVAEYLRHHKDRDTVRLIITEPGEHSALRAEIDRKSALPPMLFQTTDALISLARTAERELTVLMPFMDDQGTNFLIDLFDMAQAEVRRTLICRPLHEEQCGTAFKKRRLDFARLSVEVYEYARPSSLPSGRETFHAKMVLADGVSCYIGSSNLMGSALDRSLECGVLVTGKTAGYCSRLLDAVRHVASQAHY